MHWTPLSQSIHFPTKQLEGNVNLCQVTDACSRAIKRARITEASVEEEISKEKGERYTFDDRGLLGSLQSCRFFTSFWRISAENTSIGMWEFPTILLPVILPATLSRKRFSFSQLVTRTAKLSSPAVNKLDIVARSILFQLAHTDRSLDRSVYHFGITIRYAISATSIYLPIEHTKKSIRRTITLLRDVMLDDSLKTIINRC